MMILWWWWWWYDTDWWMIMYVLSHKSFIYDMSVRTLSVLWSTYCIRHVSVEVSMITMGEVRIFFISYWRALPVNTARQRQFTWYCSDLHLLLLLLVTSLIEPPPGKSAASPPSLSLETDRRACSEDDDDALTSLKQLMETMLNATMSCSSSSSRSDDRGRGGWE